MIQHWRDKGACKGIDPEVFYPEEDDDAEQAKDAMKTIKAKPGSLPIANYFDDAVHVVLQTAPEAAKVEWLIVRKGALIAGVGDEELLLKPNDPPTAPARFTKDESKDKMKAWLSGAPAPAAVVLDAGKK